MYDYNIRNVNDVLHSKSTLCWSFCYIQNLIGIVDFLAFQGVICARKTNIELFSCLMRRMQWNGVRRKLFLVSEMLLLL